MRAQRVQDMSYDAYEAQHVRLVDGTPVFAQRCDGAVDGAVAPALLRNRLARRARGRSYSGS